MRHPKHVLTVHCARIRVRRTARALGSAHYNEPRSASEAFLAAKPRFQQGTKNCSNKTRKLVLRFVFYQKVAFHRKTPGISCRHRMRSRSDFAETGKQCSCFVRLLLLASCEKLLKPSRTFRIVQVERFDRSTLLSKFRNQRSSESICITNLKGRILSESLCSAP